MKEINALIGDLHPTKLSGLSVRVFALASLTRYILFAILILTL
jgi:hypothetical protein